MTDVKQMTSTLPPFAQAISGAFGSAAANVASYPLDIVATRIQTANPKEKQGFSAIIQAFKRTLKKRGLSGLYDGLKTDTGATLLSNFFYYYAYTWLRSLWLRYKTGHNVGSKAVALPALEELGIGFIAGVISRAVSTPLSLITVRMQKETTDDDEQESSIVSTIESIYRKQGLKGFWKGFRLTTLLCLNPSITLLLYQLFRRVFLWGRYRDSPTPGQAFLGAAFSNSIAVAVLYPLILAKTRIQTSNTKSVRAVLNDAYRSSGFPGLYQGIEIVLIKGFLNQGWTMMTKQRIEQLIISAYLYYVQKRALTT